jgi:fermentation-respiration switch protein FrsA (DUF1100 family)
MEAVMKKDVCFYSEGEKVVGHIYLPDIEKNKKHPAIVVVTPWGGVKEQTAAIYAKKLSEKGFITLAFDHRSYGESDGVPRCNEDPLRKVEDIKNAVSFLETLDAIDKEAISALGICSGAAYVAYAAATEQNKIKAIASVSGYFHDLYQRRYLMDAIGKDAVNDLMIQSRKAKEDYIKTGVAKYLPHIPDIDDKSLEIVKDFYSYYRTERGNTPTYVSKTLLASFEKLGAFSAIPALKAFTPNPCLFIVGANAQSAYESEDAFSVVKESRELFVVDEANHTDLYDKAKFVDQAVKKLEAFYKGALSSKYSKNASLTSTIS